MDESKFVARNGRVNIKEIDKGVRNKFNWSWMEEKDHNDEYLSEYIRKVNEGSIAYCITCKERLKYGSRGKKTLHDHSKNKNHVKALNALKCTQSLPAVFTATKNLENCVSGKGLNPAPYGSSGNIVDMFRKMQQTSKATQPTKPQPTPVSVIDRKSHQEGLICAFIAENNLPFGIAPKLISLSQELSKDPKALNELSMERISATYKMKQGVHLCMRKRLLQHMRSHTFSFNIDESTTKGSKKRVLNVLVCYFSDELGESITFTDHYCSLEMTVVNSQTVYDAVTQQMMQDGVPFENLISVLSDSAAYMRGCENGFHKKLQKDAPHLVDIDGDVCHHIHNFTSALDEENLLCSLLDDLHTDLKFSADLREDLKSVSENLGLSALPPLERVPHRWLSLYDTTERLIQLTDQLTIFYFSWLPKQDKEAYKDIVINVLKKSSPEKRKDTWTILSRLKSKKLTLAGKARKQRIVEKLFYKRKHLAFLMSIVAATLPLFKSFVLIFEQKAPLVHKLHDKMLETLRSFLASFIKLECLTDKKLLSLDPADVTCHLPLKLILTGKEAAEVLSSMCKADKTTHLQTLQMAYIKCTIYLQKKMPIENKFLRALSALDPIAHGYTASEDAMKNLAEYFPTVITPDKHDEYVKEVRAYHLNKNLSPCDEVRLDHWWTKIMEMYPTLSSVVKACLSIFCGPAVKQSFSMMNNIITPRTNRLDISTYAAYQGIKHHLMSRQLSAVYHIQTARQSG